MTAEDGVHVRAYRILVRRLSPQDATLTGILANDRPLLPAFQSHLTRYTVLLPPLERDVVLAVTRADGKIRASIAGHAVQQTQPITAGETHISIDVTAADGVTTGVYELLVIRDRLLRDPSLIAPSALSPAQCAVCLNLLHRPKRLPCAAGHTLCDACLAVMTRSTKACPVDGAPFEPAAVVAAADTTHIIKAACVYRQLGCAVTCSLAELPSHALQCEHKAMLCAKCGSMHSLKSQAAHDGSCWKSCAKCDRSYPASEADVHTAVFCGYQAEVQHDVTPHTWEAELRAAYVSKERELAPMMKAAAAVEAEYRSNVARIVEIGSADYRDEYTRATELLSSVTACYAAAVHAHPKAAAAHFRLGLMMEEQQRFIDRYEPSAAKAQQAGGDMSGKDDDDDDDLDDLPDGTFDQGSSINKEDDIRAICELHSVPRNAPITAVLKAIDTEYQQLKQDGNFTKADYVQGLYSWKSKQARSIRNVSSSALRVSADSALARAATKYQDAFALDSQSREYAFHAGRSQYLLVNADLAVTYLRAAVSIKANNAESRFYLGLAMCQRADTRNDGLKLVNEGLLRAHVHCLTVSGHIWL